MSVAPRVLTWEERLANERKYIVRSLQQRAVRVTNRTSNKVILPERFKRNFIATKQAIVTSSDNKRTLFKQRILDIPAIKLEASVDPSGLTKSAFSPLMPRELRQNPQTARNI